MLEKIETYVTSVRNLLKCGFLSTQVMYTRTAEKSRII